MDLKVVFAIVCLCALAITATEAGIPKCCLVARKNVPWKVLKKVYGMEEQQGDGACDIPALKLFVKDRKIPICADPKLKKKVMLILKSQNKQ